MRRAVIASLLVAAGAAAEPPAPGSRLAPVSFADAESHPRAFPDGKLPLLIQYEDKDAGPQNKHVNGLIGAFTDQPQNQGRFEFVPVADVEKWNWWPAKKYVLSNIRATNRREKTNVWIDWKGEGRRSWGLTAGRSGILLCASDGTVRFAAEGPLEASQVKALEAALTELGLRR